MTKAELLAQIDKLQRRWQYHAVEHRAKRENNSPSYDAYDHGVATGFLKALNTFSDWTRRLETGEDQGWISVVDALPEYAGWYIVCNDENGKPMNIGVSYRDTTLDKWLDEDGDDDSPGYWMPIPKLPKK